MSWFSDLASGTGSDDASGASVDPAVRARQLLEGVVSSATAADELGGVAARAEEAARRIAESVPSADGAEQREALERLDRLHFALLRVVVRDEDPDEVGVEAAVEGAEEMAVRLGASPASGGG